jgi:hypothetical protein
MPFFDFFTHLVIAQATSTPTNSLPPPSSAEIELIRQQIAFLKDANTNLSSSFNSLTSSFTSFTTAINIFFGIAIGVITVIGTVATFLGIRAIDTAVKREVNRAIALKIDSEISYLKEIAGRESVLDEVSVAYLSPGSSAETPAFKVLQHRIESIRFKANPNDRELLRSNVVILDLDDSNLTADEASTNQAKQLAQDLTNRLKKWAVLIIYTADNRSPIVNHLRKLDNEGKVPIEYTSANMKVTLMANVVEAAYVSHALQNIRIAS